MATPSSKRYTVEKSWQVLFKDVGISTQDILRHAQLPLGLFARKSPTVTAEEYIKMWNGLAYTMKDVSAFPLQLVQAMTVESFSPPLFACFCSENLTIAAQRIAQYKPLIAPLRLDIQQDTTQTTLAISGLLESTPLPASLMAMELVWWVHITRMATREHVIPLTVHTTVAIDEVEIYEDYFGVRIQGDSFNGLTFSAEDAQRQFLTANEAMWSIFEPELRQRMEDLTEQSSFRERVRACLIEILASGHYSMADVASKLAVSTRTLQRRLKAENTSFQQELDSLREELARHYLLNSDYSSGQIAFLIGYEEPNSFFRAFRSWTGQTPELMRSNAHSAH